MMRFTMAIGLAALLLAGCEVKVNRNGSDGAATQAHNSVGDGEISIDTPGFDMKLDIPEALRSQISGDSDIIYPGSKIGGLNVTVADGAGQKQSQVIMRFTSADPPEKLVAWYRNPARVATFTGVKVARDGNGFRIAGTDADGGDPFDLGLAPAAGGGTQAQLTLRDRN